MKQGNVYITIISLKNVVVFFLFVLLHYPSYSQQDTLKGKIISSISRDTPHNQAYILEKGTSNGTIADSLGFFTLIPEQRKEIYMLEIILSGYPTLDYKFDSKWTKLKNPKSIVLYSNCKINFASVVKDFKEDNLKLYISGGIAPIANSKKDKRFEKKYKVRYYDFGCEIQSYECLEEYNKVVFKLLDARHGSEWRDTVRKDVVSIQGSSF